MKSDPPIAEPEPLTEVNLARVDQKGKGKRKESEMWTDVYRPKKFTDLLGDDVSRYVTLGQRERKGCLSV